VDAPETAKKVDADPGIDLKWPRIENFKIHVDFRLFISSKALDALPINTLQECNKIVIEPMKGLKQNLTKIISSTPDNAIDDIEKKYPAFSDIHKKLFFVLSFYHAIMNER
jgi:hypothetical protein